MCVCERERERERESECALAHVCVCVRVDAHVRFSILCVCARAFLNFVTSSSVKSRCYKQKKRGSGRANAGLPAGVHCLDRISDLKNKKIAKSQFYALMFKSDVQG